MTNDEFLSKYLFKELTEDVLAECEHFSCGVNDFSQSSEVPLFTKGLRFYQSYKISIKICHSYRTYFLYCSLILLTRFSATPKKNYWQG